MRSQRGLLTLGVALFFAASSFHVYTATLPLYFAQLGFDPTLIGLLIGATAVAEIVAAVTLGPAIDRFGGRVLFMAGAAAYVGASLGYVWLAVVPALAIFRALQGFGIAATIPSAYSYVPKLVVPRRQTVAFASLGAANSLAMAIFPPLGLVLMDRLGPPAVFTTAVAGAVIAMVVVTLVPAPRPSGRPIHLTFRRAWVTPLAVNSLVVVQWGVIAAFLPLNATDAGTNPGLLFSADAVAVLASRVPAGWAADRYGALPLTLAGIVSTVAAVVLLLLPLNDGSLVLSGLLNGLGGGLVLPPMLAQLSYRSDDSTRGTALAYFNVAFAVAMVVGSSFGGLLYPWLGFRGLLAAAAAICATGVLVALRDPVLRIPRHARADATEMREPAAGAGP